MEFIPKHESLKFVRELENIPSPPPPVDVYAKKGVAFFDKHVAKPILKKEEANLGQRIRQMHNSMRASYEAKRGLPLGAANIDQVMYYNSINSK